MPDVNEFFKSGGGLFGFSPFQQSQMSAGLGGLFGGLFGDSGAPYEEAMKQYRDWASKSEGALSPYAEAGRGAMGDYQSWLKNMSDPSGFINNLMSKYQQSPGAKYQMDQAMRAARNMGSATGLTGSTPLTQFAQQQASGIASQDMNQWLQNVLGINTQYGAGEAGMMNMGEGAANALANMYANMGQQMGEQSYNKQAAEQNDMWNMFGGMGSLASMFL